MMKERLVSIMQKSREDLAAIAKEKDVFRLYTVVCFSPSGGHLPVHLSVSTVAFRAVGIRSFDVQRDLIFLEEEEILGEVSDNYSEIHQFLSEIDTLFSTQLTFFMSKPLEKSLPFRRHRTSLSKEDLLYVFDKACQTGDFSLWDPTNPKVDVEVGFRILEEFSNS